MKDESSETNKKKTIIYLIGVILVLVFAVGGSVYVIKQKPEILGLAKNSQDADRKEIEKYVTEVSKLMLLPEEDPTLATVADPTKVKDQPFYKNAEEGDKVLIYYAAKKAILYRPSENKIIEVGAVNIADSQIGGGEGSGDEKIEVEPLPSLTPAPEEPLVSPTPTITPTVTIQPSITLSPSPTSTQTP